MAEEEPKTVPDTVTTENGVAKEESNGKRGGGKNREDQVPVEELFDLTKPIPRVSFVMHFLRFGGRKPTTDHHTRPRKKKHQQMTGFSTTVYVCCTGVNGTTW